MTRLFLGVLVASALTVASPAMPTAVADVTGVAQSGSKAVADAVIWIDVPSAARTATPQAVLDQRDLKFFPRVLVVQQGTRVKFPNSDRVFHNVFSYHDGQRFDLGLYPVGAVGTVPFDKPGLSRVFCRIHPQMAAYVLVVDTPHFAVSDDAGRFTVRSVPVGEYRYRAWRPGGTILNLSVDVKPGASVEVRWP
jgi:plastocyanin